MSRRGEGGSAQTPPERSHPAAAGGLAAGGGTHLDEPVRSASPEEPPWAARLAAGDARSLLEVAVLAGRLEVVEHYGDGAAARLADEVKRLGCEALLAFHSPCG